MSARTRPGSNPPRRGTAAALRAWLPSGAVLYALLAALVIAGVVAWDRTRPPEPELDPFGRPIAQPVADPAQRARNGVQGLHQGVTVVESRFDEGTEFLTIGWMSKYYDAARSRDDNREYLATEGRLAVQLIFHDTPQIQGVRATLYDAQRRPLAVVEARPADRFEGYRVTYAGPLQ